MVKLIGGVLSAQRISRSAVILALLFSCATAFAQDTVTAVNTDVATPAFKAGEATEALGVSEPTMDGSTMLIWGAALGGGYYIYDESTKTASTTSSASAASTNPGTGNTLNCNYVNSSEDYQVWVNCQLACSYYGIAGTASYISQTCGIVKFYNSAQRCVFNSTAVCP